MGKLAQLAQYYPKDGERFEIEKEFNLVCCDCGLNHSVILETKRMSKKIYATFTRDETKTQLVRVERQIKICSTIRRGMDGGSRTTRPAGKENE